MLAAPPPYEDAYQSFRWRLPAHLNIGVQVLDSIAETHPDAPAIIDGQTGAVARFGALAQQAARLSAALHALGCAVGDRVAVILPQRAETVVAQAAILRSGLVSVPLSERYGSDALAHRMRDSEARVAIVSAAGYRSLTQIEGGLPALRHTIVLEGEGVDVDGFDFHEVIADQAQGRDPVRTGPDDPCLMIYTSGTTGPAKGALHGHRVLEGHRPGFEFAHGGQTGPDAVFYTPADWAWAGGLLNLLFPALAAGAPVVSFAQATGFDAARTVEVMRARGVTHAFLPPTALRLMWAQVDDETIRGIGLRSVMSAGEALGRETYQWADNAFGFPVSEAYGQTECNLVIGSSAAFQATRPGATGKPVPGHRVYVVREDGSETEPGELGEIAVGSPDPVMFLEYWKSPSATARKFMDSTQLGRLLLTGDMAMRDVDGFIWFTGRDDDVITSSGHRIGPGEIEDCLTSHPSVSMAAVIGVTDPVRTQIVRAFVVLRDGYEASDEQAFTLKAFVRERLAAHEYPRDIRFVDALPMTTTGKIIRRMLKQID